jgi:ubiquitin carboxyl-terminal hydrolase 22/27/51
MNSSISHYKMILRSIYDANPIIPQTSTNNDGQVVVSLTSNYLCLQCPHTVLEDDLLKHGEKTLHRFCQSHLKKAVHPHQGANVVQMSTLETVYCIARCVMIWCGTQHSKTSAFAR